MSPSLPFPELSRALERTLGARLVAVIAGVEDTAAVHAWARGEQQPPARIKRRLHVAADITQKLLAVDGGETVRAWLLGINPALDGAAPALMLAKDPERVALAARAFVANG